uniref:Coat protein n=1 Tax=Botrytis cinerea partitivirus 2 TaxID=2291835 RepID=A0A411ELS0_9VIRU|nr:coat protein [Botrytis cinerea partitivirus 2]
MSTRSKPTSKFSKYRDYDNESGKNRVKSKSSKKPILLPESETESELEASESEVETEYEIKTKDVHRQKSTPARPRKVKAQADTQNVAPGEEAQQAQSSVAPAYNFLVALAYRQGTSAVQYDSRSFYTPDCQSLFSAAFNICDLLTPNSLVHEFDPSFMSISFYLYTAHLFYYHILRIRDAAGEMNREERRCLRHYENVGPAEAWPVPTPFIGILESYGTVQPPSKFYGKIVPQLPKFENFTVSQSLTGLNTVAGFLRVPCVPAMQQFLRNFGSNVADFENGILYPTGKATLAPGATGNVFLGLSDSATTGNAQYLFFNHGWNTPTETEEELVSYTYALKRALVSRMNIPNIGDTTSFTGLETYLGFRDDVSKSWMKNLLRSASTVTRFFPDSVNLSAIGTRTQEELLSSVTWSKPLQRNATADRWYYGRSLRTYSINAKVNTEQSGFLYKAAASAAPNSDFTATVHPLLFANVTYSPARSGPYFVNPTNSTSVPLTLVEIIGQPDPLRNMLTFIDEQLYDNLGGRSRS